MERKVLGKVGSPGTSVGIVIPAGTLIFISGMVALDEAGQVIAPGDMEAQARFVFRKIGSVLQEAGATLADVVKITSFVTDISQYDTFAQVRQEAFGAGPYPASATVEVAALVRAGLVVEVEAVAVV